MSFRRRAVRLSALLILVFGARPAHAQAPTGTIVGRVTDSSTAGPVVRATVTVVGANRGAVTRDDGTFVVAGVPAGTQRLRVSLIGYQAREQSVAVGAGTAARVDVALTRVAVQLSEMVVVGYGTQRRADLTGAVSSVQQAELAKTTVNTLEQGLQGRVPGVQVTQGDAAPGGGMRVQIRGINSMNSGSAQPLYVIDGMPISSAGVDKQRLGATSEYTLNSLTETNPLATLAPEDIETIDILKDASATAIYGSRGANGVVLITTKRGSRGARAGQYTLNFSQGAASVVKKIDVLNAPDYATYVNTAFINAFGPQTSYPYGGRPGSKTPDQIRSEMGAGVNWQDLIFRSATVRDGTLGFSGGDEQGSYAISSNLLQQDGVIRGSQFRRGGLRINFDRNVSAPIRVSSNMAVTRSLNNMVRSATQNGWNAVGIVRQAVTYVPMSRVDTAKLAADPRAEDASTFSQFGANPLRYTDEVKEADQVTRGIGGLRGVATLPAGFSLDVSAATNYERRTYMIYFPRSVNEGRNAGGDAVNSGSEFGNFLSENLLRFNREVGGAHRVDAVGGFTFQKDRSVWNSQEVQSFPDDILGARVLQNGTNPQKPQSGVSTSQLVSYLGRVNYSLLDRYLFTATVRADGSSKFAVNNKWATFPAFAVAWKAIEEPLLRRQTLVSELKVRASWGKSGNQAIGAFQSLPAIAGTTMTLNEAVVPAYVVSQLGNPNLRWETTTQQDLGVDLGAWNNRFTATVDLYRKNTDDLLQNITLAGNTGFSNAWINSGRVSNRGIELQAGVDVLTRKRSGGLSWNVSANASRNRNRIESLGPVQQQFAGRLGAGGNLEATPFIQKPGLPIGAMWGYRTAGIVRTAADSVAASKLEGKAVRVGDVMYRDLNNDGKINASDREQIGDANAKWVWGLNNRVSFGNLDVSALLTAVRGNSIVNTERMRYLILDGTINVPHGIVDNTFDPKTRPDGRYPMIRQDRKADTRFSDLYVEDGSYVRLKNVQVAYTLTIPRTAHTARVYVNAVNLATWTRYTGFDPEVSAFGSTDRPGVDQGSYPQSRLITVGINTTF